MFDFPKEASEFSQQAIDAAKNHLDVKSKEALKHVGKDLVRTFAVATALPVMAGVVQYLFSRKNIQGELEDLKKSYSSMTALSPSIQNSPDLAAERFRELTSFAPTVAKNPKMAAKVIEPRLKKGFSIDDIHKLTMIQTHSRASVVGASPMTPALNMAGIVADRVFTTFGRDIAHNAKQTSANLALRKQRAHDEAMEILMNDKGDFMNKKASAQKVSDECLGEMLADRYVLWKEASAKDVMRAARSMKGGGSSVAAKGLSQFGKGLAFFAAPLAIAGLAHGVGAVLDARKKSQLDAEADKAFAKVKSTSEPIKENPALAAEAFDAIKTFAPVLAAKPLVLKSFVEYTIKTENLPHQTIKDLADAQGNVNRSKPAGFAQGFFGAMTPALSTSKALTEKGEDL